jgi:hypothetical protein
LSAYSSLFHQGILAENRRQLIVVVVAAAINNNTSTKIKEVY